jgi:hypothetical protein
MAIAQSIRDYDWPSGRGNMTFRSLHRSNPLGSMALVSAFLWHSPPARAITPDNPGSADVRFTINASSGGTPISPYIYGMNHFAGSSLTNPVNLDRLGGNRWTGYNWETNYSNAGNDFQHFSDNFLVGFQSNTPPGEAVRRSLVSAAASDRALIVTVPIAGYASADANGSVTAAQAAPSSRWRQVVAKKETHYPGSPLSLTPNKTDAYVFTDEFVNWVEQSKAAGQEVFYSLDNEPGLWNSTHPRIHPTAPTFAELRSKTIEHASAIKDIAPHGLVFGGVGYGWQDFVQLQNAPDATSSPAHLGGDAQSGEFHFYEYLLQQTAIAEAAQGRTLMDVLDLHWYPEARSGTDPDTDPGVRVNENDNSAAVVAARVQAPRSLWDPTYTEVSWISKWSTWAGSAGNMGPVKLLPRVKRDIDDFKPGTKIAITEYNYGGTNHISGGIAQADALGIFGREELFAANFWNLHGDSQSQFASGAFKMYLNYDGAGGSFGDVSVDAATDSIANSAVYASVDADDPSRLIVVAINRTNAVQSAALEITHDARLDYAEVYRLTAASPNPVRGADIPIDLVNAFVYDMPAFSVSTLVLRSAAAGDFNLDGAVDGDDLVRWRSGFGENGAAFSDGDNDRDGDVDGHDFLAWQRALSNASAVPAQTAVPEPMAGALGAILLVAELHRVRREKAPLRQTRSARRAR